MSHIYHPDSHTCGLCDDCPECVDKATFGYGLDAANMYRIMVAKVHYTATDQLAYETITRQLDEARL